MDSALRPYVAAAWSSSWNAVDARTLPSNKNKHIACFFPLMKGVANSFFGMGERECATDFELERIKGITLEGSRMQF